MPSMKTERRDWKCECQRLPAMARRSSGVSPMIKTACQLTDEGLTELCDGLDAFARSARG
jgi:hypothetical protein